MTHNENNSHNDNDKIETNEINEINEKDSREQNDWQVVYTDIITAGTARSTRRAYQRDVDYF